MLDYARYGPHGGKLSLLCQGLYVWSTQTKQNLRFDRHFIRNSNAIQISWPHSYRVFHVRSRRCVDTNMTRHSFRRRISPLYVSNMRCQLSFTYMYPCRQTNKHHQINLLQIARQLESPATCSCTQPETTWVECATRLSFIPMWLVAYYIFLRTFHFFVIIFLTFSTTASHSSTDASDRCDWILIEPNDGHFIECAPAWDTVAKQTPVSPPRCCNRSHQKYGPGHKFENSI